MQYTGVTTKDINIQISFHLTTNLGTDLHFKKMTTKLVHEGQKTFSRASGKARKNRVALFHCVSDYVD